MSSSSWKYICFDLEANGFKPTEIFCIGVADLLTGEKMMLPPDAIAEGCVLLSEAEMLVGHYIRGYDCPVIERLSGGVVEFDRGKIIDTLDMSKTLTNNQKHSLEYWGEILGLPKLPSPLFEKYTPQMLTYCERDLDLTVRLFDHLVELYLKEDRKKQFRNSDHLEIFFETLIS